ncbi:MAG: guanylate kinase [Longimicrobiales bacterium]
MSSRACPVVLAAPSGTGKTTLAHHLVDGSGRFVFSVSATTRSPRAGEVDGVDYHFVDRADFEAMVDRGELVEWAEVHGRLYGTPRAELERAGDRGEHVVLDIDVQGARQIKARITDAKLVFVLPPDIDTLMARLTGRGSETPETVARRLRTALQELQAVEEFDYVVFNDDLGRCLDEIRAIVAGQIRPGSTGAAMQAARTLRTEIVRILAEEYAE